MTNILTEAIKAVGASNADWRVQAGAATVLVLAGGLAWIGRQIFKRHKKKDEEA